jgi:hypothetical protein
MRVDVGLLIQRPPIFMLMRDRDVKYLKYKSDIMNEYYCNQKQFADEFEEMSKLNEDVLGDNPYSSKMNLDNFPTHRLHGAQPGDAGAEYCAASKHFSNVDPNIEDRRTLHYAGEDRTYMIVKNRYTQTWEFPTTQMYFGQTFMRAKQNLFNTIASNVGLPKPNPNAAVQSNEEGAPATGTAWKVKYFGTSPVTATLREMTPAEKEIKANNQLRGVRTFYFQAHHWRGLPTLSKGDGEGGVAHDYDDFAWIPKR